MTRLCSCKYTEFHAYSNTVVSGGIQDYSTLCAKPGTFSEYSNVVNDMVYCSACSA